jgi:asparagine synthase (glutamine-hydrolysing)
VGGLAGIIHFRGDPPKPESIAAMSAAVAHRGRDDEGIWIQGPAAFAQRRFAVSSSGRRQPVVDGTDLLLLDGRLVAPDLEHQVRQAGREPITSGNADLALAAWKAFGAECLGRFHGSFAMAIWSGRDRVLHLVRDKSGVKPLFYAWRDGRVAFASDPRALLRLSWVSRDLAHEELAEYLSFRYTHAPRTLLRDVHQLPAGSLARIDATGVRLLRWWAPGLCEPGTEPPTEDAAAAALERELGRAVERRLPEGDQAVGVLLSGGVASSAIVSQAVRSGRPVHTWNVSFLDGGADEAAVAGRVAKLYGTTHHTVRVGRQDFLDALPDTVAAMGQPVPSPAAVLQTVLLRHAAGHVRVILSGSGSNEILGGRKAARLMQELRAARVAAHLPGRVRSALGQVVSAVGRSGAFEAPHSYGLDRLVGGSNVFTIDDRMRLLRDPAHVRPGMRRMMLEPLYNEVRTDPINAVLHAYFRGWLAEDELPRADRVGALAGVEVRHPMLDEDVVALCAGWPSTAKIKRRHGRWYGKWPLRSLVERTVPAQLVWRPKRALPYPRGDWLRGEGEAFLWERTESVCQDQLGIFQPDAIRELARQHARGEADHGPGLWTLFFLDLWWRQLR